MTEFYTDPWGDEQERADLKDWSRWPLWRSWEEKYLWIEGEDFIEQDIIVWREPILVDLNARSPEKRAKWVTTGERLVIAHVRQYDGHPSDWVYLVVVHSDGDEPLARDQKIKRRVKNILRNGVRRWPRDKRAAVDPLGGAPWRTPDDPPTVRRAVTEPAKRQSTNSRFLSKRKPKP